MHDFPMLAAMVSSLTPFRAQARAFAALCLLAGAMMPAAARAQGVDWTRRAVAGPSARGIHAMAYDSARGVTVLFGGTTSAGNVAETWEWDGTSWAQRQVPGPPARTGHAMAYDAGRGVTVLFGGYNSISRNAETWEWNGTSWSQRFVSGPSARNYPAMAYDAARHVTVLYGGFVEGNTPDGETWEWDGAAWTKRTLAGPAARYAHAMVYDQDRGVCVMFGGYTGAGVNGETWEFNGVSWSQRAAGGPPGRYIHVMSYDAARGRSLVFGGFIPNRDTWQWNGLTWSIGATTGPAARYSTAMAYDSARGVSVLFGGQLYGGGYTNDTWETLPVCTTLVLGASPADQTICPSGTATFGVEVTGSSPRTYQWEARAEGAGTWVTLHDGDDAGIGEATGTGTAVLHISLPEGNGSVRCVVTNACSSVTSGEARLTVCPADFDCSGFVDIEDFGSFIEAFEAGTQAADFDASGFVDIEDFTAFVHEFERGC